MMKNEIAPRKPASIEAIIKRRRAEAIDKIDEMTRPVSVRISFREYAELLALAELLETTPSGCVRLAVADWLAKAKGEGAAA